MDVPDPDEYERTIFIDREALPQALRPSETLSHYLVVVAGDDSGRRVEIGPAPVTIGRDPRQTIVFSDTEVSRQHARIALAGGDAVAEDLGSTNGTFVDAERIRGTVPLREGSVLRIGKQLLKYERRSRRDVERSEEIDRDLLKASSYVLALLPTPLAEGDVRTEWRFLPSAQLGGDAFGYDWLEPGLFAFYLLDVSGHGVGPAMHSVAVLNLLRQRALPNVDFRDPVAVLSSLNARFQMESHGGMYFTIWYGVYDVASRTLTYGSAGHHPAYVVGPDRGAAAPLGLQALMIGAWPEAAYERARATIAPGSALYLFSDGVFEIVTRGGGRWFLDDFLPLLVEAPLPETSESERLYQAVKSASATGSMEDDFSLLIVSFP